MLSIQTLRDRGGGGGSLLPPEQNWRWPPDAEGTPEEPPNPPSYSHPCAPITTLQKPPPQAEPPAPGCTHAWLHTRTPCMQLCTCACIPTHPHSFAVHTPCMQQVCAVQEAHCMLCVSFLLLSFSFPCLHFLPFKNKPMHFVAPPLIFTGN